MAAVVERQLVVCFDHHVTLPAPCRQFGQLELHRAARTGLQTDLTSPVPLTLVLLQVQDQGNLVQGKLAGVEDRGIHDERFAGERRADVAALLGYPVTASYGGQEEEKQAPQKQRRSTCPPQAPGGDGQAVLTSKSPL